MSTAALESLIRRKVLEDIYDRMSDDEKRLFMQMTIQHRSHQDIMTALGQQKALLADLRKNQQTFSEDFASNIAGNAVWEGLLWLFRRLLK